MSILGKTFIGRLFPEVDWNPLNSDGYDEIYQRLAAAGEYGPATVDYLRNKRVKLGFYVQEKSGGGWTLLRNITLAPEAGLADAYTLCLIVHEVFHLKQSIFQRLSVRGELLAWQYQRQAYHQISGKEMGDADAAYPGKRKEWDQLAGLTTESREDLAAAQLLMKAIATGYRSDCLPLFPLLKEVGYYLRQGRIMEAFGVIRNLITCG